MFYKRGNLKHFSKFTDSKIHRFARFTRFKKQFRMNASCVDKKQPSGGVLSKDVPTNFAKFTDLCRTLFNKVAGWKPETARSSLWRCSIK